MKADRFNMDWIRDWPIRQKLTLVIMLTCGAVLLLACGLLGAYQIYKSREQLVRNAAALADVLSQNTQAALAFQDENAAQQTLQALHADSNVTAACLYDGKNMRFAMYARDGNQNIFPDRPATEGHYFKSDSLVVLRPVILNGRTIGTIYLQTSLQGLYEQLRLFGGFAIFVLFASGLAAYALSALSATSHFTTHSCPDRDGAKYFDQQGLHHSRPSRRPG